MRKVSFSIRKVKIDGKPFYQVTTPNPDGGRPKRKTFRDRREAETFARLSKTEQENFGTAAFTIGDRLRADAVRAAEILKDCGASLTDAAKFYKGAHDATKNGIPLADAVDRYLKSRKINNAAHSRTLKSRLELFASAAGDSTTASITSDDVETFLDGLPFEPRTKSHFWGHLSSLFAYCTKKGWATCNPVEDVARPTVVDGNIEFLSPDESSRLLNACDDQIRAGVVIPLFCGLRQCEINRLDWQDVDFEQNQIKLDASQVKRIAAASRRVVPIPPNALIWLLPLRKKAGSVWPEGEISRDLWTQARISAGFGPFRPTSKAAADLQASAKNLMPWPANGLRHSAISYKVAIDPNLDRIAYESGNSPEVIKKHYNGLASPAQAEKFFSIQPAKLGKIVKFAS
jgi:integrase